MGIADIQPKAEQGDLRSRDRRFVDGYGRHVEDIDTATPSVGHYDQAGGGGEPGSLGRVQPDHQRCDLRFEGGCGTFDELPAGGGDGHLHTATIEGGGRPGHEPALLGSVDQASHARFIQLQEAGQLLNARSPIPQDAEEPGLDDLGAGKVEYFSYKQRDYDYYVYGDTVVMTGRTRFCPEVPGKGQSDPTAVHHNPRQSRGQWRLGAY